MWMLDKHSPIPGVGVTVVYVRRPFGVLVGVGSLGADEMPLAVFFRTLRRPQLTAWRPITPSIECNGDLSVTCIRCQQCHESGMGNLMPLAAHARSESFLSLSFNLAGIRGESLMGSPILAPLRENFWVACCLRNVDKLKIIFYVRDFIVCLSRFAG